MVDVIVLANEVVELYKETAEKAGIEIQLKTSPETIKPVPMDRESIHSCLANLLTNALDACQASDKEQCTIIVGCYEKDDCLILEVADEGCGMAYEVKQKIFTNWEESGESFLRDQQGLNFFREC